MNNSSSRRRVQSLAPLRKDECGDGKTGALRLQQTTAPASLEPTRSKKKHRHRRKVSDDSSNEDSNILILDNLDDEGIWSSPSAFEDMGLFAEAADSDPLSPHNIPSIVPSIECDDDDEAEGAAQTETKSRDHHNHQEQQQQQQQQQQQHSPPPAEEPEPEARSASSPPPPVFAPPMSPLPRPRSLEPTSVLEASGTVIATTMTTMTPTPTKTVVRLEPTDVVCGRGAPSSMHPGNRAYRAVVRTRAMEYLTSSRRDKPSVARELMDRFREEGVRFVRRERRTRKSVDDDDDDDGRTTWVWVALDERQTYDKVCQSLREDAPLMRRKRMSAAAAAAAKAKAPEGAESFGGDSHHLAPDRGRPIANAEPMAIHHHHHQHGYHPEMDRWNDHHPRRPGFDASAEAESPAFSSSATPAMDPWGNDDVSATGWSWSSSSDRHRPPPAGGDDEWHGTNDGWVDHRRHHHHHQRWYPRWHGSRGDDGSHRHRNQHQHRDHRGYTYKGVEVPYYVHLPPHLGGERLFGERTVVDDSGKNDDHDDRMRPVPEDEVSPLPLDHPAEEGERWLGERSVVVVDDDDDRRPRDAYLPPRRHHRRFGEGGGTDSRFGNRPVVEDDYVYLPPHLGGERLFEDRIGGEDDER